jgi:hypothetical protein
VYCIVWGVCVGPVLFGDAFVPYILINGDSRGKNVVSRVMRHCGFMIYDVEVLHKHLIR